MTLGVLIKPISHNKLIIIMALFFTLLSNYSFFSNVLATYPFAENSLYVTSVMLLLFTFLVLFLNLITTRYSLKITLIIMLLITAFTSYFMDTYHVIIDDKMVQNIVETNIDESLDLFSFKLLLYLFFLGILPSIVVYKTVLQHHTFKQALVIKLKTIFISLGIIVIILLSFSKFYTSFFREHKVLRFYTNPTYWIYSIFYYANERFNSQSMPFKSLGLDAHITSTSHKRKLVIMVVGEATRADHFSLNGYEKETNPLLKKEKIINFPNFYSCGTSTAVSVPCMFSFYTRDNYSYNKGINSENVLDVLNHTGKVSILWRDNNSDSKGVAKRLNYEDFKTPSTNPKCDDDECRDEGMLTGLEEYINEHKRDDILIVLHQMGNHGPAYYKRYPKTFEKFTPVCQSNQLEQCTQESISNAYDNATLYSDYFLSKTINLLKNYNETFETSLLYISDHGESLGEHGLYLHGLPYFMAPDAQKHVAAFAWFGNNKQPNIDATQRYNQDYLFHTLLGLFEVKSSVYNEKLDIFKKR